MPSTSASASTSDQRERSRRAARAARTRSPRASVDRRQHPAQRELVDARGQRGGDERGQELGGDEQRRRRERVVASRGRRARRGRRGRRSRRSSSPCRRTAAGRTPDPQRCEVRLDAAAGYRPALPRGVAVARSFRERYRSERLTADYVGGDSNERATGRAVRCLLLGGSVVAGGIAVERRGLAADRPVRAPAGRRRRQRRVPARDQDVPRHRRRSWRSSSPWPCWARRRRRRSACRSCSSTRSGAARPGRTLANVSTYAVLPAGRRPAVRLLGGPALLDGDAATYVLLVLRVFMSTNSSTSC